MNLLGIVHAAAGAALVLAAWLLPRRIAEARPAGPIVLLTDFAWIGLSALLLDLATGRPIFTGAILFALGAGFTLADYTMRETLHEPVVFSESVELPQVFTHPHLYLPFAGPGLVLGGAAGAVLLGLALLVFEPPLWPSHPWMALVMSVLIGVIGRLLSREPLLGRAASLLRRLKPTGEPFEDAAALGPFAMLLAHAVIARAERPARQRALAAAPMIVRDRRDDGVPVVIVQNESFFDARRLSPLIPPEFLAGFDACGAAGALSGRIGVPGWGANTMRAEFAVLSGIPERELGYDRFNPYYALARVPLESQVWRLRRAGYRTICLHPFDRRFFRRDLIMPALGFEEFRTRETIGGSSAPPYFPDPDLAREILRALDEAGPRTFVFAITMGNHGPWSAAGPPLDPSVAGLFDPAEIPDGGGLLRYLDGLRRSDAMLRLLMDGLERRGMPAALAFYGDHLPSLAAAFGHFGFAEPDSDYVARLPGAMSHRRDLRAHELGRLIVDAVLAAETLPGAAHAGACHPVAEPAGFGR